MKCDTGNSFGLGCWDTSFRREWGVPRLSHTDLLLGASVCDGWLMMRAKAWDGGQCDDGHVLGESVLVWCLVLESRVAAAGGLQADMQLAMLWL